MNNSEITVTHDTSAKKHMTSSNIVIDDITNIY